MINLKRILCPTDLSTGLDQALRYALALAHAYDAQLSICYRPNEGEIPSVTSIQKESSSCTLVTGWDNEVFENALLRFMEPQSLNQLNWHGLLIKGEDVGEAIARTASECAADLIVMRSRRRPHRAALLGSTAES